MVDLLLTLHSIPTDISQAINEELREPGQYDDEKRMRAPNHTTVGAALSSKEISEPDMRMDPATSGYHIPPPFDGPLAESNDPEWDPNAWYNVETPAIWTTMDDVVDNILGNVHVYWQGAAWQAYDNVAQSLPTTATSVLPYYSHVGPLQGVCCIGPALLPLQLTLVYHVYPACSVCKERSEEWCCPIPECEQ